MKKALFLDVAIAGDSQMDENQIEQFIKYL